MGALAGSQTLSVFHDRLARIVNVEHHNYVKLTRPRKPPIVDFSTFYDETTVIDDPYAHIWGLKRFVGDVERELARLQEVSTCGSSWMCLISHYS
jgi:hypothetical protein